MECQAETNREPHRNDSVCIFERPLVRNPSSLSSDFDAISGLIQLPTSDERHRSNSRRNYLNELFEKKKLKEKSLSKKMKTPFDRKPNRTCWPIQLSKVSKIKKKPREKRKGKPTKRSLRKRKFSNPSFASRTREIKKKCSSSDESDFDDQSLSGTHRSVNKKHFLYEPVTPQMLMDVLRDPEHLKSGATLDMIISKLRALKLELNPTPELLQEEVLMKLECAIKLGLVIELNGFYMIAKTVELTKLPRKKVDAFWVLWHLQMSDEI